MSRTAINIGYATYRGPLNENGSTNPNDYKWDQTKYDSLIANHKYREAAEYADMYTMNDPREQYEYKLETYGLMQKARRYEGIYANLRSKSDYGDEFSDYNAFEFADAFENGDINNVSDSNGYAKRYKEMLTDMLSGNWLLREGPKFTLLGAISNGTKPVHTAGDPTYITATFEPKTQTFLGMDWLAPDNDDKTFTDFAASIGMTMQELQDAGVKISNNKDGGTTITFDTSNNLTYKILHSIDDINNGSTGRNRTKIATYDKDGNVVNSNVDLQVLSMVNSQINSALDVKNNIDKYGTNDGQYYTSTIGASLIDGMDELQQAYKSESITSAQYNKEMARYDQFMRSTIQTLGAGNWQMYTNAYIDGIPSDILDPADAEQRENLVDFIAAAAAKDPKSVQLHAMASNGQIGTLITVSGNLKETKDIDRDSKPEELTASNTFKIFIPGLFQEEAQRRLNADTTSRSIVEINNMKKYGYEYTFSNDISSLYTYGQANSIVYKNGKFGYYLSGHNNTKRFYELDEEDARRYIELDTTLSDIIPTLQLQHSDRYGNVIFDDKLDEKLRKISVGLIANLYQGVPLYGKDGQPIDISNISQDDINFLTDRHSYDDLYDTGFFDTHWQSEDAMYNCSNIYYVLLNELNIE